MCAQVKKLNLRVKLTLVLANGFNYGNFLQKKIICGIEKDSSRSIAILHVFSSCW